MDSIKSSYGQVVLVDNGGFFPESDPQMDAAWFLMDAMKMLNTAAVGTSERELRWGLAYLKSIVNQKNLPMVSSNLLEASTRRSLTPLDPMAAGHLTSEETLPKAHSPRRFHGRRPERGNA